MQLAIRVRVLKAATVQVLTVATLRALVGGATLVGTHPARLVGVVRPEEMVEVDPEAQRTLMARQGTSPIGGVMRMMAGGPTEADQEDLQAETRMIQIQGPIREGLLVEPVLESSHLFKPMARASMRRGCRRILPSGRFPQPWEWRDWVLGLNSEMYRVVAPHGGIVVRWLGVCEDKPHVRPGTCSHR